MKNYSIIEDFSPDHCQNINFKNHHQALSDCFKRNLVLIRRYFKGKNKPTMGILKKLILPGYIQEFNSQISSAKNRFSQSSTPKQPIFQESSDQIITCQFSSQCRIQQCTQQQDLNVKQFQVISKTQPSVKKIESKTKILNSKVLSLLENFGTNQSQQNRLLSKDRNKGLFQIRSPKKMIPVKNYQQLNDDQNKQKKGGSFCSNIDHNSISFHKKKLFTEKSQNQTASTTIENQKQNSLFNLTYIRNSYTDLKCLNKKMFALIKQRKSTKILKAKLFSQLQGKNLLLNQQEKQLFTRNKHQKKMSFERFNESPDFKLKGKQFIPFMSRSSLNLIDQKSKIPCEIKQNTCVDFRQKKGKKSQKQNILANLKQRISILDQKDKINEFTARDFGANKFLITPDKRFRLPHFNQQR